ncbi:MAG TPA: iron-containing alcohol dehydrogenase [Chthoniobacterales bacterium]|nr:iron-containing alcohol dehydrogenase [Chthoniobacterales bacterium]
MRSSSAMGELAKLGPWRVDTAVDVLSLAGPRKAALRDLYPIVGDLLERLGLDWEHFDGVLPNPTVDLISTGAKLAKKFRADVILGIGGGSSLDSAKAIAVEATHEGTSWDYLFFKQRPSNKTLPVVAVGTTSGSGSQATQVAVSHRHRFPN